MVSFLSFIVVFGLVTFVHEFGHFVAARLAGVHVEEFGFGYPPRLLKLGTWRGTTISLNALPIGGFVRMSEDDPSVKDSLASKGRATRALVYVAGALMNVILTMVLLSVTFMMGALTPVQEPGAGVYYVSPQSPAQLAGIRPGDTIVNINGQAINQVEEAVNLIKANAGQPIDIVLRRNGDLLPAVQATPRVDPPPNEGALGVALDLPLVKVSYPAWRAVPMGIRATFSSIGGLFAAIRATIRKQLPFQVTGPIGIYNMTAEAAKTGLDRLIEFTAFLSINLFLLNLLPLPALDGGRLIFVFLEWLRGGRKIAPEKEGFVHAVGMVLILGLMVVVTVLDYFRYFG